ncbi:MAG: ROK family protein, partial [Anaerolineales bacterium]
MNQKLYGGVELGGTKVVCAIGSTPGNILCETTFPTHFPSETIPAIIQFFQEKQKEYGEISSLGIACFGPLDLDQRSANYGKITATPKSGWVETDILSPFEDAFNIPVYLDTDVNGAAIGEWLIGAGRGLDTILYMTVGTGIGVGAILHNKLFHGENHPEMGHMRVPH